MLKLKSGVKLQGIRSEIIPALLIVNDVYVERSRLCEITSGLDGLHSEDSLHYKGLAFDVGVKHMTEGEAKETASEIQRRLGEEYDVVFEGNHIHVEFDPR